MFFKKKDMTLGKRAWRQKKKGMAGRNTNIREKNLNFACFNSFDKMIWLMTCENKDTICRICIHMLHIT